ncbi:hypothetical protein BK799_29595 [Rhodococcus sp. D-1]|nr:hypothetical protein BK799_29595 [Rhodococcus sp. D-1]
MADTRLRLQADVFEECATSLLSVTYPNLVPVRGGADSGRDADLIQSPGIDPVRMAITSSRSEKGARANLRTSLKSLKEHGIAGVVVISVSLAEMNEAKRRNLQELAGEHGYELHAVIDRGFFADRLLTNGLWREKLLGLPGGPFSLSRTPVSIAFGASAPTLVGRDSDLEAVQSATQDVVVWGVPGVGKSALLSQVRALYFVEGRPTAERLMDDILETQPSYLAVDDAVRRLDVVEMLINIRRQERLKFILIVVCWPHERDVVRASLLDVVEFEVEPLIRSEIARIVRSRGVDGSTEIAQVLQQSQGRPAWAVYLADLIKSEGGLQRVYSGIALHSEVLTYLERSGLQSSARDVVAFIAVMGSIKDSEVPVLAHQLGVARADLTHSVNDVAIGGLLDVIRQVSLIGDYENRYCVAPDVLATRIVIEYYFSGNSPVVPVQEVFNLWPSKRLEIAIAVVKCALAGAAAAIHTAHRLFQSVLDDSAVVGSRETLMHHYLHLGQAEAEYVVNRAISTWADLETESSYLKEAAQTSLISYLGEAIAHMRVLSVIARAADVGVLLYRDGEKLTPFLSGLVDKIRGFGPDATINVSLMVEVWKRILSWLGEGSLDKTRVTVGVSILRQILRPTFDASWMSSEDLNIAHLASGTIPSAAIRTLSTEIWDVFENQSIVVTRDDLCVLVDLADDWSRVARGFGPNSDGEVTADQKVLASRLSLAIADFAIEQSGEFPGIRARLRVLAQPLGKDYAETDLLIAVLFEPRRDGFNWMQWREHSTRRIRELVNSYLNGDPNMLCRRLAELKPEFDVTGVGFVNRSYMVFAAIAESTDDLLPWLYAARDHNLLAEARALVALLLDRSLIERNLFVELLAESALRSTFINAALSESLAAQYFDAVESAITPDDIGQLELVVRQNQHSTVAISRLLTTERPGIPAATAAALLAATEVEGEFLTPDIQALWDIAIADLKVPLTFDLFGDHDFFEKLLVRAPIIYENLLIGIARDASKHDFYTAVDTFGHSGYGLGVEAKTRILNACTTDPARRRVFWALNGGAADWIIHLLDTNAVDIEFVLGSVNSIGPAVPIHELARILVPRGVDPTEIASKIELGTQWGDRHERLTDYVEQMTTYATSTNPEIASVGRAGVALFEPRRKAAAEEHKRNMIRGRF